MKRLSILARRRRDVRVRADHDRSAPYESTMGLVQKIFYFHVPSWMVMFTAGLRLRDRERDLPVRRRSARPIASRVAAAELTVVFGIDRADHRSALGAEGVGRLVGLGRAADVHARAVADLRRLSAAAALRRRRVPSSWRPAWRSSAWRTCRSCTGRSTSGGRVHPKTTCRADAAAGDARAVLVLRRWRSSGCSSLLLAARVRLEAAARRAGCAVSWRSRM